MAVATGMLLLVSAEILITSSSASTSPATGNRVLAISYLGSLGVSAVAVPGIGFLYERTGGFTWMFALLSLCAAAALVAATWLPARPAGSPNEPPRV